MAVHPTARIDPSPPEGPRAIRTDEFRLTVEHDAATLLLRIEGDFDLAGVGPVETALERALSAATPIRHVVFDLRAVSFLDMAGLGTMLRAEERSRQAAFDVQVVSPTGRAKRVFTLTRVGSRLTVLDAMPGDPET